MGSRNSISEASVSKDAGLSVKACASRLQVPHRHVFEICQQFSLFAGNLMLAEEKVGKNE